MSPRRRHRVSSLLLDVVVLSSLSLAASPVAAGLPAVCGDSAIESDEECDDGNAFGGDGCAANCTNETERTFAFTMEGSDGEFNLAAVFSSLPVEPPSGQLILVTGAARASEGTGLMPVVIRTADFDIDTVGTIVIAFCVRAEDYAPFGPGNAGSGYIACEQPLVDSSYVTIQDFNTADVDPGCALGTLIDGWCVGAPQTDFFGSQPPGAASIVVNLLAGYMEGDDRGPDNLLCSDDDTGFNQPPQLAALTTDAVAATVTDVQFPLADFETSSDRVGVPFDCDAIAADPSGGLEDGALVFAMPVFFNSGSEPFAGVASLRLSSVAPPTPTPTSTRTPTPTRTPSRTRTPTKTFTPTPTPTRAQAPDTLIVARARARANTAKAGALPNGTLKIDANVDASPPFGNLVQDIAAAGLTVRASGGGIDATFAWLPEECSVEMSGRGPRVFCAADDAPATWTVSFRPIEEPGLFRMKLRARNLDLPSPLSSGPIVVEVSTSSFDRTDAVGCSSVGGQARRLLCRVDVPTPTPTQVPPTRTPLGERIFSLARPGSGLFSSVLPTLDVSLDPWLSGPLRLVAGTPDTNGIAPLALAEDVIVGGKIVDGSTFCVKLFAAGSAGTIDCDGGSAHDVLQEFNVPGTVVNSALGDDAGPGAASMQLMHSPTLLGSSTTVADCAGAFYGSGFPTVYTTATTTGIYYNPSQGGAPVSLSKTGENFDCSTWSSEDSAGRLVSPISASNGLVGTVMTIVRFADRPPGTPTPAISPTPTPTAPPIGTPLGDRVFSIGGTASEFRSSSGFGDLSNGSWLSGPLLLHAGAPDASGVAPITLQADVIYGFGLDAGGVLCVRMEAAGSGGSIDCDGGSAHAVLYTHDSNASDPADAPIATTHIGPDSGPGAATLTAMQSVVELASPAVPADCLTATFGAAVPTAYSTDRQTVTVAEPVQGGSINLTAEGVNFSCADWTEEDGVGVLVGPRTVVDGPGDDEAQAFILGD